MPVLPCETWTVDRVPHPALPVLVATDEAGALVHVSLGARHGGLVRHAARHGARLQVDRRRRAAARQVAEYLVGRRRRFDLPLRPLGSEFQRRVWRALAEIPYGETWSYGQLARRLGDPAAARAVGQANNHNPLPLVLPCHRVIGGDGQLVGFGGGLPAKRWLLALEQPQRSLFAEGAA